MLTQIHCGSKDIHIVGSDGLFDMGMCLYLLVVGVKIFTWCRGTCGRSCGTLPKISVGPFSFFSCGKTRIFLFNSYETPFLV